MAERSGETSTNYPTSDGWLGWGGKFLKGFTKKGLPGTFSNNAAQREVGTRWGEKLRTPAKPPPVVPDPPVVSPPSSSGVPAQPTHRAGPRTKKKTTRQRLEDWYANLPEPMRIGFNQAFLSMSELGQMPRTSVRNPRTVAQSRSAPRSKQLGLVGDVAQYQPTTRGLRQVRSTRPGVAAPGQPAATGVARTVLSSLDTKPGEELTPAVAPQEQLEPIKVPKRERYTDLQPIEVPQRVKYGTRTASAGPGVRSGRVASTVGTRGGAATARNTGRPAPSGRAGTLAARLPAFNLGDVLEPIIRAATTRTPSRRPSAPSVAVPRAAPRADPIALLSFAPGVAKSGTDTCECEKKKPRKARPPRSTCRQGTYTQSARGISYRPNRIVPCT